MGFPTLAFGQIRDAILRDILNQNPQAAVGADSDFRLRANSTAGAVEGLYQAIGWTARQIFPDTADEEQMLQHAAKYGIFKKAATAATGAVKFSGAPGSPVSAGVEGKALDGFAYVATEGGTIGVDGTLVLAAIASTAGFASNQDAGTVLTLTQTPAGVSSSATIVSMTTGTDIESSSAVLARLLDRLRHPPAGGNKYDYRRWALEVPGVSSAWCYPLRRGLGTVDVAILSNGFLFLRTLHTQILVPRAGIEPARLSSSDFKSLVSTNFTIEARAKTQPNIIARSTNLRQSHTWEVHIEAQAEICRRPRRGSQFSRDAARPPVGRLHDGGAWQGYG